ncbi:minor capsid protein [Arthrobacter phage Edmundo]|nr:minor capsid protein [Arthrobacter phage Edmundo]
MAEAFESTVTLAGHDALTRILAAAGMQAPAVLGDVLYREGQLAFRQTQKEVPVKWGNLKNSGRLHPPKQAGTDVEVLITYGSTAVKYAAAVHEKNKNYRNGRKWKYVHDPVVARADGMEQRIVKRIQRSMTP